MSAQTDGKRKDGKRKLAKAEEHRKKKYEEMREILLAEGYKEKDLTIGVVYANVMAFVLGLPIILPCTILFIKFGAADLADAAKVNFILLFVLFIAVVIVHELIHGIVWGIFAKGHLKAIQFGFIAEYLTPYCCCTEPLSKGHYIVGALMPTVLLGILPCVIAICNGSWLLFLLGCVMIIGGGGDMTIVLKLLQYRSESRDVLYIDHPYECGTMIFEK